MIYDINDTFPIRGNWKYKGETIENVLKKDSGYIRDLIRLNKDFILSEDCMNEAKLITKGHKDLWEKPNNPQSIFDTLKPYGVPYGFDFNNEEIQKINKQKIDSSLHKK